MFVHVYISMHALPLAFRQAPHSEYRRRIAALAQPLDAQTRRRVEFARFLDRVAQEAAAFDRPSYTDLPKLMEIWRRVEQELAQLAREGDPAPWEIVRILRDKMSSASVQRLGLYGAAFLPSGFLLIGSSDDSMYGPLLSRNQFLSRGASSSSCPSRERRSVREDVGKASLLFPTRNEISCTSRDFLAAALVENRSGQHARSFPKSGIIDAVILLEEAVYKINAYRYYELEPIASSLLCPNENELEVTEATAIFRRRIGTLAKDSSAIREVELLAMLDELSLGELQGRMRDLLANTVALFAHFTWRIVAQHHNEDPVQHTLDLMNRSAQNTFLTDLIHDCLERNIVTPSHPSLPIALSRIAPLAFGDPIFRLSDIYGSPRGADEEGPDAIVDQHLMPLIALQMGYRPGPTPRDQTFFLISHSEEEIRAAARTVLEEKVQELTGKPLEEVCPVAELEGVMQTRFIAPDQLPLVAGIWKERYAQS